MQKGQVSFDLILAVIIALIFIGGMQLLNEQMQEAQKESTVRTQEKAIALNLYRAIATSHALRDADEMEVNYRTEKLIVPEEGALQECTIRLNQIDYTLGQGAGAEDRTKVEMSIEYTFDSGENVRFEFPAFDITGLSLPAEMTCGETLAISKS